MQLAQQMLLVVHVFHDSDEAGRVKRARLQIDWGVFADGAKFDIGWHPAPASINDLLINIQPYSGFDQSRTAEL
jgi:hypothetical protein